MTVRKLKCSCCGESAGRWTQHWNMDRGYGACVRCITWMLMRGESEEEITSRYGKEGTNWGMALEIYGHRVQVLAAFREHEATKANEWMAKHEGHALLGIYEGELLIAHEKDLGTPIVKTECAYADCRSLVARSPGATDSIAKSWHDNKSLICGGCEFREALDAADLARDRKALIRRPRALLQAGQTIIAADSTDKKESEATT